MPLIIIIMYDRKTNLFVIFKRLFWFYVNIDRQLMKYDQQSCCRRFFFFFILLYSCHMYRAYFWVIAQLYTLTIERQFFKNLSPVEIIINVTFTAVISNSASPSHWKESYVLKIPFLKIIFDLSLLHDSRLKKILSLFY